MAEVLYEKIGESITLACGNWADAKAIYRFLNHSDFTESQILDGHFQATVQRFKQHGKRVFIIHDTTEFAYYRKTNKMEISTAVL